MPANSTERSHGTGSGPRSMGEFTPIIVIGALLALVAVVVFTVGVLSLQNSGGTPGGEPTTNVVAPTTSTGTPAATAERTAPRATPTATFIATQTATAQPTPSSTPTPSATTRPTAVATVPTPPPTATSRPTVAPTPTIAAPYAGPDAIALVALEPDPIPHSGTMVFRFRLRYSLGSRDAARLGVTLEEFPTTDCTPVAGGYQIGGTIEPVPIHRGENAIVLVEESTSGTFQNDRMSVKVGVAWYDAEGVSVIGGPNLAPRPCIRIRSLSASVQQISPGTGEVAINGVDTRRPDIPFTFDWGDGTVTESFFPARHVYANPGQNYVAHVTAHYANGVTDTVAVTVSFAP